MAKVNIRRLCRWHERKNYLHRHAFEELYPALKGVAVRGRRKMLGLYCFSLRDTDIKSQYLISYLSSALTQFCSYLRKKVLEHRLNVYFLKMITER